MAFTRTPDAQSLELDLVGLVVDTVAWAVDSAPAADRGLVAWRPAAFTYDGRVLRVRLPPLRGPAEADVAKIRYHGTPRDGLLIGVDVHGRRGFSSADNLARATRATGCPISWTSPLPRLL